MGWSSCDCFRAESGRLSRKIHRNEIVFESKCIENSHQCRSSSSLILHKSLILSKYRESCTFAMHEAVSFKRYPKPMFQHFPLNVATCVVYIHFRCVESISHGVFHVRTSWHRMVWVCVWVCVHYMCSKKRLSEPFPAWNKNICENIHAHFF